MDLTLKNNEKYSKLFHPYSGKTFKLGETWL